jgi:hypothetical protein
LLLHSAQRISWRPGAAKSHDHPPLSNISQLLAARAAQYDTMMTLVIYLPRESDLTRYVVIQMNCCLRLDQKSDAGFGLTSNVP